MKNAAILRQEAQQNAAGLPALLAQANQLASTVLLGEHGRRRAGVGDHFWQYRQAQPMDGLRAIDWRRSARSDETFVQDKEWQTAQTVTLWVDTSASMRFRALDSLPSKADRGRLLALSTAILLDKGGERFTLSGNNMAPTRGSAQIEKIAAALSVDAETDHNAPGNAEILPQSRALFISDFLGDIEALGSYLAVAADRGVQGVLLQVLDPQEESFPFSGRTVFQSMTGTTRFETLKADGLRSQYLDRLAERKDALHRLAEMTGWAFQSHTTDVGALPQLIKLHEALGRKE